jgi:hypothetical protein
VRAAATAGKLPAAVKIPNRMLERDSSVLPPARPHRRIVDGPPAAKGIA